MIEKYDYKKELASILKEARQEISNIKPSEWAEQNRFMTADVSPLPGYFSYKNSPYAKELVDCLAVDHPARIIAVMKGAQIGVSTGLIENGIGWIISQNPGNTLLLVGHEDLVSKAGKKIDTMIDNSGIRPLIKSTTQRVRRTKSGDTDKMKEFQGGFLSMGIANHKTLRQDSIRYGFIDDFEAMKGSTEQAGATTKMIEQRFAAFATKMKLYYVSTPELKKTSNIEPVYELGDQRRYFIPCPCCGEFIVLEWEVKSNIDTENMAGIHWEIDEKGQLVEDSVGYVCQECGGKFDDRNKSDLISFGEWRPTAKPSRPGYYSYQISSLYAPPYMYGWEHYVREFIDANPPNGVRDEKKMKAFVNLCLGLTYEPSGKSISANKLQKNIRPYEIGTLPEKLSISDGNGRIMMLTCGTDLNGLEDDARLDYEIVAHSESGATYSIEHGSIGTFIPNQSKKEKEKDDREKFSYRLSHPNSVWPELEKILLSKFETDTGRGMRILVSGVDCGYQTQHAYQYIDSSSCKVFALKGKDDDKFINAQADLKTYRQGKERGNLFLVETNHTKDLLSELMSLNWTKEISSGQPSGFMNFPTPSGGRYLFTNYFSHFEAEKKILDKDSKFRWLKKSSTAQNHLFDCRLYALVVRDIITDQVFKEMKIKNGVWKDFVNILLPDEK